jgi:hypothetical protein
MDQQKSERPVSASRPARRSLIEFSLPASGALEELSSASRPLPRTQPAPTMQNGKQPFKPPDKRIEKIRAAPLEADQKIAASRSRQVNRESANKASPRAVKVADEYGVKAFELMIANIGASLEYAQRLVNVRTPTEFVDLATSQAWKQLNSIIKQTAELRSIAQRLADLYCQ